MKSGQIGQRATHFLLLLSLCGAQVPFACNPTFSANVGGYSLDECSGGSDIIEPGYTPWITADYSEFAGDATLILSIITTVKNAWFDATAPYHPTAVGIYSRFDRRPESEATTRNLNIAMIYASRPVLLEFFPDRAELITERFFTQFGLDPDSADMTDPTTPIGIGAAAGQAVANGRRHDGMNIAGDGYGAATFNFEPFRDTTGYAPVNTAYKVRDPSRWQPDMQSKGRGLYKIQQFVTPQYGRVEPYSYSNPNDLEPTRKPERSDVRNYAQYRAQADEVLAASAALTDTQKMYAEFFDNKGISLAGAVFTSAVTNNESLIDGIHNDFLANMAAFDAGIYLWNEKRRHDAVRPFTAIRHIYGNREVESWGGPGVGTVNISAAQWKSFLPAADHPEYPSASTCFCHAIAQAVRLNSGNEALNFFLPRFPGSSRIEPGITPNAFLLASFPTWAQFTETCGQSRLWAGVHFQDAIDESARVCPQFGQLAFDYVSSLVDGSVGDVRAPAAPLPQPEFYNDECRFEGRHHKLWWCRFFNKFV